MQNHAVLDANVRLEYLHHKGFRFNGDTLKPKTEEAATPDFPAVCDLCPIL